MSNNPYNRYGQRHLLAKLSGIPLIMLLCGSVYAQPANDDCDDAADIPGTAPDPAYTVSVDATDATKDDDDPLLSCNSGDGDQTIWFKYTPDDSGPININTKGSTEVGGDELDTAHGVFTGTCGALVEVACVDQGLNDWLNLDVEKDTIYYIKVGQFDDGDDAGEVVLHVDPPVVPAKLVIESSNNGVSDPVRDIVGGSAPASFSLDQVGNVLARFQEIPNYMRTDGQASEPDQGIVGSQVGGNGRVKWNGPADLQQVFEGMNNDTNAFTYGFFFAPPDTIGDVGKDHYVQMVNNSTQIFDKEGNSVLGPFPTSFFFEGMGGNCALSNDGDPVVLYDEETDRWLVSQFLATLQDGLCIAISTTGDPTGTYNQYEFDFSTIGFPDYPKFGFATGAVNVMVNLFNPSQGSALGAIDKAEMLSGEQATMVLFTGGSDAALAFGWVPGDNDGPVFDNTLPTFFTNLGGSGNTLFVAELTPDWATPENTGLGFTAIPVTPWDSDLCEAPRGTCIDQPGSGTTAGGIFGDPDFDYITYLEGVTDRMMHRGQTRDFGKRKVAMLSHTVDVDGTGKAGVRWYELRNDKDKGWKLKKENTFSPDGDHRWMGSIAMTASGETCLGYSISSTTTKPSIGITGRKGTSNHMNISEVVAFPGTNVQRFTPRWGDYSAMSIDPVNDTCWYTQENARFGVFAGETFGWGTQIIQYDVN